MKEVPRYYLIKDIDNIKLIGVIDFTNRKVFSIGDNVKLNKDGKKGMIVAIRRDELSQKFIGVKLNEKKGIYFVKTEDVSTIYD